MPSQGPEQRLAGHPQKMQHCCRGQVNKGQKGEHKWSLLEKIDHSNSSQVFPHAHSHNFLQTRYSQFSIILLSVWRFFLLLFVVVAVERQNKNKREVEVKKREGQSKVGVMSQQYSCCNLDKYILHF